MLECNSTDGKVDQTAYSHIIKMWVKDVRGRTETNETDLEVSALSDSGELQPDWSIESHDQNSLEASGGSSQPSM